eukprot:scaffold7849_cov457-Prasinococcus_capsulatus_cf.AAC.16
MWGEQCLGHRPSRSRIAREKSERSTYALQAILPDAAHRVLVALQDSVQRPELRCPCGHLSRGR